jgi:hypothetical protein
MAPRGIRMRRFGQIIRQASHSGDRLDIVIPDHQFRGAFSHFGKRRFRRKTKLAG